MPTPPVTGLPVEAVLPELRRALAAGPAAVLEAPPGAGKTTLVPLHILGEPWLVGRKILMLEPRRLAVGMALVEHVALWPLIAVVESRSLATDPRAFAQATWRHLLFGIVLGELERRWNGEPASA